MKTAQNFGKFALIEQKFEIGCENFGCNQRAAYALGNPQGPPNTFLNICEDCLSSLRMDTGFNQHKLVVVDDDMYKDELLKIAKQYGLRVNSATPKAEVINMLKEFSKLADGEPTEIVDNSTEVITDSGHEEAVEEVEEAEETEEVTEEKAKPKRGRGGK